VNAAKDLGRSLLGHLLRNRVYSGWMHASTVCTGNPRAAARATAVAFLAAGFVFASWASRIPAVRARLDLSPSGLGFVLLAVAAGSISSLLMSGAIVARLGSRRTVAGMAALLGVGLLVVASGYTAAPVLVTGLFVFGFAIGAWEMAMNVQAAIVEQHLGRPIMSRFHAGYSVGTVGGALVGAAMTAVHVSVTVHLFLVAITAATATIAASANFLEDRGERPGDGTPARSRSAWRERRTLLVGVFVLSFAFAEGTANDWINVAAIDGQGASAALAGITYALFLAAMTAGRWCGPALLTRYGRIPVVRWQALLGSAGVLLFVFGPSLAVAAGGALLWGAGASLGFPVGMSAAADEPQHAPARVGAVSCIGYCAFLAGPPLIGALGDHLTTLHALTAVALLLGCSAALAHATAPPGQTRPGRRRSVPSIVAINNPAKEHPCRS
jgi:fucose permease